MTQPTIDALVADLSPVRRLSGVRAAALLTGMTGAAVFVTAAVVGLRSDVMMLRPSEIVVLRSAALLLLGIAAASAVIASARPSIGGRRGEWRWALATAALFPAASLLLTLNSGTIPTDALFGANPLACLTISIAAALAIGGSLVGWLRRGAVTELTRGGWLVGLAAGALGTFAYSLHCPSTSVHYIGAWYSLAIAISAGIGRLTVPSLLRW